MIFNRAGLNADQLTEMYKAILKPRMVEEKMLKLLRQGKVSKWFAGIGQEAIAVGATMALQSDEYILPLHRNLGVFTTRQVPLERLFKQFQGKLGGFTKGRDRSFHFGTTEYHIAGMISHLGPQLCVADGVALGAKLNQEQKATLVFTGDGGTSEGDFHEALNLAAVWQLPVIFLIENNGYGLSTPTREQFACEKLSDRAIGYGMPGYTIDGNNILEVYHTIKTVAENMRSNPAPVLIECNTFRMRGHEEASGTKYVPKELFEIWEKRDPVINFENYLISNGFIDTDQIDAFKAEIKSEIESALVTADQTPAIQADFYAEMNDVYQPYVPKEVPMQGQTSTKRFVDAISDGLKQSMEEHDNLIIMGQDVAEYGGVFKITDQFVHQFGSERVRNTPICESVVLSAGLGLSLKGIKSVIEMQFADFVSSGFNAVVNNLAKIHYRWQQNADVVIRMPTGAGVGAGPFHSQSNEAWFFKTPGLKIVYPSNPADAKGLLAAAINDPNPVLFFEHKALYRSIEGEVHDNYYTLPIGKAKVVQPGDDLTIITYGLGVHWAQEYINQNPDDSIELIDLCSLMPLDEATIYSSVRKTGKVILLHEDTITGGIGAELSARITENCFEYLDGPVKRVASLDTPVPFATDLERQFLANDRLAGVVEELINY